MAHAFLCAFCHLVSKDSLIMTKLFTGACLCCLFVFQLCTGGLFAEASVFSLLPGEDRPEALLWPVLPVFVSLVSIGYASFASDTSESLVVMIL